MPPRKGTLSLESKCALRDWYEANGRDLPWRRTRDPYPIWISEVMLQQTQVATGLPYWERWMARFPTVEALAEADEAEVLSAWQGLGYYRRARNLMVSAKVIVSEGWPKSAAEWRNLPGIGEYTSGAIASITLNEQVPASDGNVERVYARISRTKSFGSVLTKEARTWAAAHVPSKSPGDWNQAMMELGARVCKPRQAACHECPLTNDCRSAHSGDRHNFPVKALVKQGNTIVRHHAVWVGQAHIALVQIKPGSWWEGMWEFPEIPDPETSPTVSVRHQVTQHRIESHAHLTAKLPESTTLHTLADSANVPMPAAQRRILQAVLRELK